MEIIETIDEPTNWCIPVVFTGKPNRGKDIGVDLMQLNSVERELHPMPVVEHMLE